VVEEEGELLRCRLPDGFPVRRRRQLQIGGPAAGIGGDPQRDLAACRGFGLWGSRARVSELAVGGRCGSRGGDLGGGICREGQRFSWVLRAGGSGWDRGSHVVAEQGAGVPHPAVPRRGEVQGDGAQVSVSLSPPAAMIVNLFFFRGKAVSASWDFFFFFLIFPRLVRGRAGWSRSRGSTST
jgi:hypothetical protein